MECQPVERDALGHYCVWLDSHDTKDSMASRDWEVCGEERWAIHEERTKGSEAIELLSWATDLADLDSAEYSTHHHICNCHCGVGYPRFT